MNFPIPVNLTVAQNNVPVNITVSDDSESFGLGIETQIVASVASEYEGPYTVTPSESAQTLETGEKLMADNVSVCAIPGNYVGSQIPRKSSADLTASGPTVAAPAGYYSGAASKTVRSGSASTPNTLIHADVDVLLSATGLITATASGAQNVTPNVVEGYVERGTAGTVSVDGLKNVQLPTQAAKTVTPTETEQTAVATQKYTVGEVKVAAIPSDYIGSEVPQKSSSDLTVFGPSVTAPVGYYAEAATKSVSVGSVRVYDTAIPVVPSITVDGAGKITASVSKVQSVSPSVNAGYVTTGYAGNMNVSGSAELQMSTQSAQTITPTTADQTIASGTYLTGAQTISGDSNLIAENIKKDVTLFNITGTYEGVVTEDTLLKALRNQTTSVEDDTLTSIRSYGLAYMTTLASASFPNLQTINSYAFYNDYTIAWDGWPFPKAKTIGNYAFRYCYGLTGDIVLPSTVTSIGQYSFANCDHMETFTATGAISTLGTYTWNGASGHVMALREIHLPNLGTGIALNLNFGSTTAANACQHLEICDIGKAKSIAANTFANCYKLQTLIMRRTSVTTCANVSAFLNTPLRGRGGLTAKIYVPSSLIDSYKAASVWTTINGYGYVEWLPIEGSIYEL